VRKVVPSSSDTGKEEEDGYLKAPAPGLLLLFFRLKGRELQCFYFPVSEFQG
jgi:hypothetical protein